MKRQLFYFFLFMCLAFPLNTTAQVVDIPDSNLRAAIEEHLGKASGDTITTADMATLTHLEAKNVNISDLTGLEGATNLKSLRLGGNSISGIAPVTGLTNLKVLSLWTNSISDISPVEALTNLTDLNLSGNLISDISPVEALTNLTWLHLQSNRISDIAALASLTNLTALRLDRNSISDISVLSRLIQLTELRLDRNSLTDLSPLVANTGLGSGDEVDVRRNPLNRASIQTHIPTLQSREVAVEFDDVVTELVDIPDSDLRAAIEEHLGKASGDTITTADMANLLKLEAKNVNISDLTGLEGATKLTRLDLGDNAIRDISVLAGLTNLTKLSLDFNNITDISVLAGLPNLIDLALGYNAITDHSILSGLTNLTSLDLRSTNTSDLSMLSVLTKLERLYIDRNGISDLAPLAGLTNLTDLALNSNSISDLSSLRGLTNLKWMRLAENNITDLSPLVANTGLGSGDWIDVKENPLNRASIQTHILALQSRGVTVEFNNVITELVNIPDLDLRAAIENGLGKGSGSIITTADMGRLTELVARNLNITDLTGLEHATNLTSLDLGTERVEGGHEVNSNSVSDLSPLAGLINLTWLRLRNNSISDLSPLARLTNLTELNLGSNLMISDISALSGLTNLEILWLYGNSISDLSPVAGLTNLTFLEFSNNLVSDLSPLAGLTNLEILWLNNNSISDISPVAGLTNLTSLGLNNNSISDISPVAGLTNLTSLGLNNNSISDISAVTGLTNLTGLSLEGNSISDISAVAGLTNLELLLLGRNMISDISAVAGLTNLRFLFLVDNSISDLSPLVENMGLGEEDWIDVQRNPLSFLSIYTHIPALQSRGAVVRFDQVPVLSGHNDGVVSVAFSRDGTLASGGQDGTVILWDVATQQPKDPLTGHTASARSVAFSPDGSILASGSHDGTVILWDVATQQPKDPLTEHTAPVETVAFSRDGSTLASGSHDGTVILWDVDTGQRKDTIMGHANKVWSLAFSPDGTLAIGRNDGTVLLWDVATRQTKDTLTEHTAWVESVAFTRDGSMLASGSGDNTVILWEVATGRSIATLMGHTAGVNSVAFSPDGTILASGSDDFTVRLWDAVMGELIAPLTGHTSWVRSVAFSPDGSTLASGSGDRTVLLWEIAPPPLEYTLSIPAGYNLIHVPLKVTAVDGVPQTITSIGDLYDALGGANAVKLLLTLDSHTQEWFVYFGPPAKGTPADRELTDDMGIIADMKTPVQVRLTGTPLGTNGNSTITLNPDYNLVGLPLNDSRLTHVSDLFTLEGIGDNAPVVFFTDNGAFKAVVPAGGPDDIPIIGGQAFFLDAQEAATVAISGVGWSNTSGTAAAPLLSLKGIEVRDTTLVLGLSGSIVDGETGLKVEGFRVTVKNLSTGKAVTAVTGHDETDYQLTVVDIETRRAATIGDILEISAQSPNPFIGVKPLRYTVTAEDVKRSLIQLPELVVYEIPSETQLLHNYPNPFNPETWIPYRLAEDAFVTLTIYDLNGQVVRTLDVGHQIAAVYESRSKAVYWDGRNGLGEQVASGMYFYHLSAGNYSATRKMLIIK